MQSNLISFLNHTAEDPTGKTRVLDRATEIRFSGPVVLLVEDPARGASSPTQAFGSLLSLVRQVHCRLVKWDHDHRGSFLVVDKPRPAVREATRAAS